MSWPSDRGGETPIMDHEEQFRSLVVARGIDRPVTAHTIGFPPDQKRSSVLHLGHDQQNLHCRGAMDGA